LVAILTGALAEDLNNVSIISISLGSANYYASTTDQNIIIDANIENLIGPAKDINVVLYADGAYSDSNTITIDANSYGVVRLTHLVSSGSYGGIAFVVAAPVFPGEETVHDNNYSETVSVKKIDSNILSVTPSIASGTAQKNQTVRFDVNVRNNGNTTQDINVNLYLAGVLKDSNTQTLSAGQTRIISISRALTDSNTLVKFSSKYTSNEYQTNDNNYSTYFIARDYNNARLISVTYPNMSPSPDNNRQFINRSFKIDVNVQNQGTRAFKTDLNVRLFIDDDLNAFSVATTSAGDYNLVTFTPVFYSYGPREIKISIAPINDENDSTDNNSEVRIIYVDGNALKVVSVSAAGAVQTDSNTKIDINVLNLGPNARSTLYLINSKTQEVLDKRSISLDTNDSNVFRLYTQTVSTTGTLRLRASVTPLSHDYATDNNMDFYLIVLASKTTNSDVNKNKTYESSITTIMHTLLTGFVIPSDVNELLTVDERKVVIANFIKTQFTRTLSSIRVYDADGNLTKKTKVSISVDGNFGNATTISVLETIPKIFATDTNLITSDTNFKVLKRDPVIVFTTAPDKNIVYYIKADINTAKLSSYTNPLIIKVTLPTTDSNVPSPTQAPPAQAKSTSEKEKTDKSPAKQINSLLSFISSNILFLLLALVILMVAGAAIAIVFIGKAHEKAQAQKELQLKDKPLTGVAPVNGGYQIQLDQKPNQEKYIESKVILAGEELDAVRRINENTHFVRDISFDPKQNTIKIKIEVHKAFKKSVTRIKVLDVLPEGFIVTQGEVNSPFEFRLINDGKEIEFTLPPTNDLTYTISKPASATEMQKYNSPIILAINTI
jgi:flagellar basal body-associated protein FliL